MFYIKRLTFSALCIMLVLSCFVFWTIASLNSEPAGQSENSSHHEGSSTETTSQDEDDSSSSDEQPDNSEENDHSQNEEENAEEQDSHIDDKEPPNESSEEDGQQLSSEGNSELEEEKIAEFSALDEVTTLAQLREAISAAGDGDVITVGANIEIISSQVNITGKSLTIQGKTPDITITVQGSNRFVVAAGYELTLKNLNLISGNSAAVIYTNNNARGVFENVTFTGVQPYHGGGTSEMVVRGGVFNIQANGNSPEEFFEGNRMTFEGGKTIINHAKDGRNDNAVFYFINGDSGSSYLRLTDGARVQINTGNYVLYTVLGAIAVDVGDNCELEINAAAFNRTTSHLVRNITVGENARFTYNQSGTSYTAPSETSKGIYIGASVGDSGVFVDSGGVFTIDSEGIGIRTVTLVANQPGLVSIHGKNGAFYDTPATFEISDVNAVNYWNTSTESSPFPAEDHADNWPQYVWNTWVETTDGYAIGKQFSFSGSKGIVTDGGENLVDSLGRVGTLADTLKFTPSARRIVLGNIEPFSIDHVYAGAKEISGVVDCSDIMAAYTNAEGESIRVTGRGLPLPFSSNGALADGSKVTIVANRSGLRAAVHAESTGSVELLAVPETIDFGVHTVAAVPTIYPRVYTSLTDGDGNMLVQVRDTRKDRSEPWALSIRVSDQLVPDKKRLPSSMLIFRTNDGTIHNLDNGAATIHRQEAPPALTELYNLTWGNESGLLISALPGEPGPGDYAAVLLWSLQLTP